ncbi:hypothetical protein FPQ18DRAFT_306977 [Pyronema domesticum]|nr:hypothetical protein FPQ18DRAFT_306977 [Pyronema domesticum]
MMLVYWYTWFLLLVTGCMLLLARIVVHSFQKILNVMLQYEKVGPVGGVGVSQSLCGVGSCGVSSSFGDSFNEEIIVHNLAETVTYYAGIVDSRAVVPELRSHNQAAKLPRRSKDMPNSERLKNG